MAQNLPKEETKNVLTLLGGPRVFSRKIRDAGDLQHALREGFPYAAFEACLETLEWKSSDLAELLGVATRTLARRKSSRQLSPTESDRLYRIAYIARMATDVFGTLEKARAWLHAENQALGGNTPISFLDTEVGERQVEDLLNRINYGVLS